MNNGSSNHSTLTMKQASFEPNNHNHNHKHQVVQANQSSSSSEFETNNNSLENKKGKHLIYYLIPD